MKLGDLLNPEQYAINLLCQMYLPCFEEAEKESLTMAINALETVAEMKKRNISTETILEYAKFEDECVQKGFTFKSLLEAREKQTAKPIVYHDNCGNKTIGERCPMCFGLASGEYCEFCGQHLKWGD